MVQDAKISVGKQIISVVNLLASYRVFAHSLTLRSEGPPMSRNFQQIHPVIKDDN